MRYLLGAGLALGLVFAAACGEDSVGPRSLADPQATTAQLAALDDVFDTEVLNSFTTLSVSGNIAPAVAPALAAMRTAMSAGNPLDRSSALRPYGSSIARAEALRQVLPTLAGAEIIPPEVRGTTFEWNVTNGAYGPTSRAGAPSNGVRFILYALNPLTGLPADPLVEVGYVDIMDESTSSTAKLHIRVAGVGGTPVYVDYTVTVTATLTSGRITAAGYVTNAAGSPDTLRFSGVVTVSGSETSATITQDVSFDVNSQDVHIRSVERLTLTQTSVSVRIDFRFEHGDEVVTLVAVFEVDDVSGTGSGTVTVRVNGGLFATCTGAFSPSSVSVACEGADADGLNADEEAALQAIAEAVARVGEIFLGLFIPALGAVGA